MRLRNIMLMLAASAMLFATACDKDDNKPENEPEISTDPIDVVYKGTFALTATMGPTTMTATNDSTGVMIGPTGDNKLGIRLPATELKETHSIFPSAVVKVEYTENADGSITLKETEFETEPDAAGKTCKGKLSGLINNGKLTLTGEEKYGNMPVTCTIIFPYTAE